MHRDPSIFIVEHRDEFEACTEGFEVLAKRRDPNVLGVLQLGDRALGDVESTGQLCLADCLTVVKFVQPDFLEGVASEFRETLGRTGAGDHLVTEL
jgi:hypothetical protein